MITTIPRIRGEIKDYSEELSSGQRTKYTTGELVLGLIAAGTLVGSVVGNHYLMDCQNFISKANLGAFSGEAAAFMGCYLGKIILRNRAKHSEDLESKISLN